jgi:heme/copper-type cytochrome/quinol oxidase subunit 2
MPRLTPKQFFRALPVSLLIVVSIWTLTMIFLLVLPSFSTVTVRREDRDVVEGLRRLATWAVAITVLCGATLGICIPAAIRWYIRQAKQLHEQKADN